MRLAFGLALTLLSPGALLAQGADGRATAAEDWSQRKCALYAAAVQDALAALGPDGLRPAFLTGNRAFIASGCVAPRRICAETAQEYAFADLLTVMTMNEGMASTFVTFGCGN